MKLVAKPKHTALAKLDRARRMLAEARTLGEVKKVHDIAEAARTYARAARLGRESQNYAAEITLLAARKAGELLRDMDKNPGGQPAHKGKPSTGSPKAPVGKPTLEQLGISKKQSADWQKLAKAEEGVFTSAVAWTKEKNKELTTAAVLRDIRARVGPWPEPKKPDAQEKIRRVQNCIEQLYGNVAGTKWHGEVARLLYALVADFNGWARQYGLPELSLNEATTASPVGAE